MAEQTSLFESAVRRGSSIAYLGLGSNLGDRRAYLIHAINCLRTLPGVELDLAHDVASLYETSHIGGSGDNPNHLNTVVRLSTLQTPRELLASTKAIELQLGRRHRERWSCREIDIDLLLFGEVVINSPELELPHPRLHERRFVLAPLAEIAPDVIHPSFAKSISDLLADPLMHRQRVTLIPGPDWVATSTHLA